MNSYKEAKRRDFSIFKELTNTIVVYDGLYYNIMSGDTIVSQGTTNEEIYSFIAGYLNSYNATSTLIKELEAQITDLDKINKNNIKMYESLLKKESPEIESLLVKEVTEDE